MGSWSFARLMSYFNMLACISSEDIHFINVACDSKTGACVLLIRKRAASKVVLVVMTRLASQILIRK